MRRVIFDSLCPSPAFSPFSWSLGSHVLGGGDDQPSSGFIRMHVRCEPVIPLSAALGPVLLEHQHPNTFCNSTRRPTVALPLQFVDMNGWLLLSSDRHEVPTALNPREQLVTADLRNLLDAYQELYWVAPSSYLGDQVREWGTTLTLPTRVPAA